MPFSPALLAALNNNNDLQQNLSSALLSLRPPEQSHEYLDRFASTMQDMPEQEPRSFWAKLGAGLIGAGAGLNQGPAAGVQLTRSLLDRPYKSALEDWARQAGNAQQLADIESKRNQIASGRFNDQVAIAKGLDTEKRAEDTATETKRYHNAEIANQDADNARADAENKIRQANADREYALQVKREQREQANTDNLIENRGKNRDKATKPKTSKQILENKAASKGLAKSQLEDALGFKFDPGSKNTPGDPDYVKLKDDVKTYIKAAIEEHAKSLESNPEAEVPASLIKSIKDQITKSKVPGFFSKATLFGDE